MLPHQSSCLASWCWWVTVSQAAGIQTPSSTLPVLSWCLGTRQNYSHYVWNLYKNSIFLFAYMSHFICLRVNEYLTENIYINDRKWKWRTCSNTCLFDFSYIVFAFIHSSYSPTSGFTQVAAEMNQIHNKYSTLIRRNTGNRFMTNVLDNSFIWILLFALE